MRGLAVAPPPSPHFLLLHRCDNYNYFDLVLMVLFRADKFLHDPHIQYELNTKLAY